VVPRQWVNGTLFGFSGRTAWQAIKRARRWTPCTSGTFTEASGLSTRPGGATSNYIRWCFADPKLAEAFATEFKRLCTS
ncbi:MAG: hypothetical protein WCE32_01505, partial [Pseudolabrys sp.]